MKLASLLLTAALTVPVWAQDLRSLPPLPSAVSHTDLSSGLKLVTPSLKGLRVLAGEASLAAPGSAGVDLTGIPLLAGSSLPAKLQPRIGRPLYFTDIARISAEIRSACVAAGRQFVQVIVPPQDITSGVLTFVVIEAKLGQLKVVGAKSFSEASYREVLRLAPGQPIDQARLDADIDWLGRSGFRRATVQAAPGREFGTTDLVLEVQEQRLWQFTLNYADAGTATTDDERISAGVAWGHAFGQAQELSYQLTTSPDLKTSVAHAASYTAPINRWRHIFSVDAAWSTIRADIPAPFDSKGYSWQVALNYEIPLPAVKFGTNGITHSLTAGLDVKETNNNIEFSSIPVTDNTTQIVQLRASYDASAQDKLGGTSLRITGVFSPGGLIADNDDAAFAGSRSGAEAAYAYLNFSVQRQTMLPGGFGHGLTITGQISSANLLGSEQLGLGGAHSVRGYDEGLVYGDEGVLLRNELTLPAFGLLHRIGRGLPGDSVRLLGFWDYGVARSKHLLAGEDPSLILSSVGIGVRYRLGDHFNAQFDYGWQQKDVGFHTRNEHGRGHVSATVSW